MAKQNIATIALATAAAAALLVEHKFPARENTRQGLQEISLSEAFPPAIAQKFTNLTVQHGGKEYRVRDIIGDKVGVFDV